MSSGLRERLEADLKETDDWVFLSISIKEKALMVKNAATIKALLRAVEALEEIQKNCQNPWDTGDLNNIAAKKALDDVEEGLK